MSLINQSIAPRLLTQDVPQIPSVSALQQGQSHTAAVIDLVDDWLASLRAKKTSERTINTYGAGLRRLCRYLKRRKIDCIQEITSALLQAWQLSLVDSSLKPRSVDVYLRAARGWCRWLIATNQVFFNPARDLSPPKIDKKLGPIVSEKDMLRLLDGVAGTDLFSLRDRAILEFAYSTGARLEEMARLNMQSVDLPRRSARLYGKGNRERVVPLTRAACVALRVYLDQARRWLVGRRKQEQALFISYKSGLGLTSTDISRVIKKRAAKAGLRVAPHTIRRSIITHMVCHGAPLAQMKALLGHSSYRHLGCYAQLQTANILNLIRQPRRKR